jgi:FkbM family methyltransferase
MNLDSIRLYFRKKAKFGGGLWKLPLLFWRAYTNLSFPRVVKDINPIIQKWAASREKVFFVSIGANDGVTGDPICEFIRTYHWSGLMVEPVPALFTRLQENFKDHENIAFENSAISDQRGVAPFYTLTENNNPEDVRDWEREQLGTFDRELLISIAKNECNMTEEPDITSTDIECITFDDLADKHKLETIDFVNIDTEGLDWKVLSQIDLVRYQPALILYETANLPLAEYKNSLSHLRSHGYRMVRCGNDTLAIKG